MAAQHARPAQRQRALVPVLVFLGMVVAVISSLGAPLVPTIATVDHVSLTDAQWSLTITLLVGAVATPTMGRLGDGPHRRRVILGATAVVLAGSVLAALPLGFGFLVAGRGLQGVGLGLVPLAIATARDALPAERSRPAVAMLSITTVAGVGLGYPLTGLIAETLGVHAGFWFGAIISALALAGAAVVVPRTEGREKRPLDALGAILLGAGLAALLLALSEGESWGWASARLLGLTVVALLLLVGWGFHELRTAHPLVDLRTLRNRAVLTADVCGLIAGIAMYMLMSMVTRFVQTPSAAGYGFGASVLVAGLVLLPFSAASVASSKLVPALARRTSMAVVLPFGCAVSLLSMVLFLCARTSLWELFVDHGRRRARRRLHLRRDARTGRQRGSGARDRKRHQLQPGAAHHRLLHRQRAERRRAGGAHPRRAAAAHGRRVPGRGLAGLRGLDRRHGGYHRRAAAARPGPAAGDRGRGNPHGREHRRRRDGRGQRHFADRTGRPMSTDPGTRAPPPRPPNGSRGGVATPPAAANCCSRPRANSSPYAASTAAPPGRSASGPGWTRP